MDMMRCVQIAAAVAIAWCAFGADQPKPLAIQNVALAQYEDGPNLPASSYFVPGEAIFMSFQVSGYRSLGDEEPIVRLGWRVEAQDPEGVPLIEPKIGKLETELAREDKDWMPKMRHTIEIPSYALSGTHQILLWVKDEIAQTEALKTVDFNVRGRSVEPSPTLVIRNLRFYRSEEDKEALEVAAYRPGDAIWIRFDITGFKLGEENRFEVGYGISVLRPNGQPTFTQPEAAAERDQSFYPRKFVPAAFSLNLPQDVDPGQYTVIITAQDKMGGQTYEARSVFTAEK
jgi:hypothetical protein